MPWLKACPATLAAGTCKAVHVGGVDLAIFNVDGRFHATSNICTHQFALLSEGYLEGESIECPLHQGRFNVVTGAVEDGPVDEALRVYPVQLEGGEILVDLGEG